MKVLVTGSSGFIGRHLTSYLEDKVQLLTPDRKFFREISDEKLRSFLKDENVEVIIHLATHFVREASPSDLAPLVETNILLGLRLLEASRKLPLTFVNTGTSWQDDRPSNLYASTKKAFQEMLACFETPTVTLKLFETYGPADPRDKILNLIDRAARRGEELALSPGEQILDLTYVEDIISAFHRTLELIEHRSSEIAGKEFGVSGDRLTLRELVKAYESATGRSVAVRWGALPYRDKEVMVPGSGLLKLPGWKKQVSLEEGLRRTFSDA